MNSPTYRRIQLYAFRAVLVSTILQPTVVATGRSRLFDSDIAVRFVQCVVVFGHHFYSIFSVISLPSLIDLIFLLGEITASLTLFGLNPPAYAFQQWDNPIYTMFLVSVYSQVAALVILFIVRVHRLKVLYGKIGRKSLYRRFEFDSSIGQREPMSWWLYLFGASVFSSRYMKENILIRGFRALLAYIFIFGIIILAFFAVVLGPVQEESLPPVKIFRSPLLPSNSLHVSEPVVYRIFAILHDIPLIEPDEFERSINVTALWDGEGPECWLEKSGPLIREFGRGIYVTDQRAQLGTFICPNGTDNSIPPDSQGSGVNDAYRDVYLSPSDFLITINFTSLNVTSDSFVDAQRGSVSFLLGLTSDDEQVFRNTIPTSIFPGSHLLGGISLHIRQTDNSSPLASLGIIKSSKAFLITNIVSLAPDPSPLINRLPNMATLRIFTYHDLSDWTVVQDYREHTVLDGFTKIGGFWVFTNGLFAFFFGSTLAMIVLGVKPISIFGALDGIGRSKIRNQFHKEYPLLAMEVVSEQRGLLTFLREHIVDLDVLSPEEFVNSFKDDGGSSLPITSATEQSALLIASGVARQSNQVSQL